MFNRLLNPLTSNSFFIFGARGTGKSTFLRSHFQPVKNLWFDLLQMDTEDQLRTDLKSFSRQIERQQAHIEWVIVDEIQKIPELLNEVHHWIEKSSIKFALTGSSARKLKRGHANLLAGRAFVNYLFPMTHLEVGQSFDLSEALSWGTLPKIFSLKTAEEKEAFLRAYAQTYLKEEIWSEHFIRKLDPFRRFLQVAAQTNGQIVNFTNIAKDVGSDVKTVQSYFEILEDTLLGFFLEPYHRSIRKQQRMSPKFFIFDAGVKRALEHTLKQPIQPQTYSYGDAFESFIITEIHRLNMYHQADYQLSYLLTKDRAEIDLIIDRPGAPMVLIEIKSKERVDDRDTRSLEHFLGDFPKPEAYVFSRDPREMRIGNVTALPWQKGIAEIGLG